jgi:hypothetical protein
MESEKSEKIIVNKINIMIKSKSNKLIKKTVIKKNINQKLSYKNEM